MTALRYVDYFHDGSLYEVRHFGDRIDFYMSSAEMDPEDEMIGLPSQETI